MAKHIFSNCVARIAANDRTFTGAHAIPIHFLIIAAAIIVFTPPAEGAPIYLKARIMATARAG